MKLFSRLKKYEQKKAWQLFAPRYQYWFDKIKIIYVRGTVHNVFSTNARNVLEMSTHNLFSLIPYIYKKMFL